MASGNVSEFVVEVVDVCVMLSVCGVCVSYVVVCSDAGSPADVTACLKQCVRERHN